MVLNIWWFWFFVCLLKTTVCCSFSTFPLIRIEEGIRTPPPDLLDDLSPIDGFSSCTSWFTRGWVSFMLLFMTIIRYFITCFKFYYLEIYCTIFFVKEVLAGYPGKASNVYIALLFYTCVILISQTYHTIRFSLLLFNGQVQVSAMRSSAGNVPGFFKPF